MQRLILLLVLALGLQAAQMAHAAEDPFTVSGIQVDATAASATQAETIAINTGRAKAWTALYRHLTKQEDWARQPALDDVTLQRIVRNYLPMNARRSTTRYVASMTYVFNPDAVRRILQRNDIAYTDVQAHPIMVIPMSPGYQAHSAWAQAWSDPHYASGPVPLLLPQGDTSALGGLNLATAGLKDVQPFLSRAHAQEAYLAELESGNGPMTIKLKRLGSGPSAPIPDVSVPAPPPRTPPTKAYASAADATASAIIDAWKGRSAIDFTKRSRLVADIRFDSLSQWGALQQKLATIPGVTDVFVIAMNMDEARLAISYVGTQEQLSGQLAQAGLDLSNEDGTWILSASTAGSEAVGQ
jgi:hypothetical protein